jgi:TatD DNase family protein
MIDIGINLLHTQFDDDRHAVLERARAAGVHTAVLTATDLDSAEACQRFIEQDGGQHGVSLHTTAGVHPHDAASAPADLEQRLEALASHPAVVAIGEAGLDYHRNFSPRDTQRQVFEVQAALAARLGKTLFVHDRDSNGEVLEVLRAAGNTPSRVIVHCFTGDGAALDACLRAGYWIGITGWVCDRRRGAPLRDIVTRIPLERLLIETDAPFLLPHNVPKDIAQPPRGRRNEPAYLMYVARQLASLYGVPEHVLTAQTAANARQAFALSG